ncbi:MAG: hypothetical protein KKA16_09330 [Alphaproteobacteria bacterium]|nr:hypothetical protein [Alphaproteobacteria bacterium]
MTDQLIDMNLPESFHRLKRTVMLFAAAFAILGLSASSAEHELHSPFLDIKVATWIVRWILWLGGAYYLVGFLMEALAARQINSKALRGSEFRRLEQHIESLADRGQVHDEAYEEIEQNWRNSVSAYEQTLRVYREEPYPLYHNKQSIIELIKSALSDLESDIRAAQSNRSGVDNEITRRVEKTSNILSAEISGFYVESPPPPDLAEDVLTGRGTKWVNELKASSSELSASLETFHRDLTKLSPRITGGRRVSFWIWEIGGAAGAFTLSTIVGWWPAFAA